MRSLHANNRALQQRLAAVLSPRGCTCRSHATPSTPSSATAHKHKRIANVFAHAARASRPARVCPPPARLLPSAAGIFGDGGRTEKEAHIVLQCIAFTALQQPRHCKKKKAIPPQPKQLARMDGGATTRAANSVRAKIENLQTIVNI